MMVNGLNVYDYNALYSSLKETDRWLQSKRIVTKNTRFMELLFNIDFINKHFQNPKLSILMEQNNKTLEELLNSLLDAEAYIEICQNFKNLRDHEIPRKTLRESLYGPLIAKDETTTNGSINARNKLFELTLAAKLIKRGINISSWDDIEFEFENTKVNIQCKRIHSFKRIGRNIEIANTQLNSRIADGKKGMIALAIEKISDNDRKFWDVDTVKNLSDQANKEIESFIDAIRESCKIIININILAIIIELKFIARIREHDNLWTRGFIYGIQPLCENSSLQFKDRQFLIDFGSYIGAKFR